MNFASILELFDERLRESGFSVGPPEVVVVAGVSDVLAQLSDCRFEVSRLTDPDRLDEFLVVSSQIWGRKQVVAWRRRCAIHLIPLASMSLTVTEFQ